MCFFSSSYCLGYMVFLKTFLPFLHPVNLCTIQCNTSVGIHRDIGTSFVDKGPKGLNFGMAGGAARGQSWGDDRRCCILYIKNLKC